MDIYAITQERAEARLNQKAANMSYEEMMQILKNNSAYHSPDFQAALRKAISELEKK